MNFPLADLAGNLKKYPIISKFFNQEESASGRVKDPVKILSGKGVFPYEWFDDFNKLYETKFPPYEAFRSKLLGWDEKGLQKYSYKGI